MTLNNKPLKNISEEKRKSILYWILRTTKNENKLAHIENNLSNLRFLYHFQDLRSTQLD